MPWSPLAREAGLLLKFYFVCKTNLAEHSETYLNVFFSKGFRNISGRGGKGRAKGTQAFGKGRGSTRGKGFAKGKEGLQRPMQLFSFGRDHPDELYAQAKAAKQLGRNN